MIPTRLDQVLEQMILHVLPVLFKPTFLLLKQTRHQRQSVKVTISRLESLLRSPIITRRLNPVQVNLILHVLTVLLPSICSPFIILPIFQVNFRNLELFEFDFYWGDRGRRTQKMFKTKFPTKN